jgi:hypothetical protein
MPHLQPTNPIAPRVVLVEDPARAMALAMELLEDDRLMANHAYGLWGYSGTAREDGDALTVQSTGIGGPSATVVLEDLADHGVREALYLAPSAPHPGTEAEEALRAAAGRRGIALRVAQDTTGRPEGRPVWR